MVESSRTILSENGRKIQIIESGKPEGVPILVQHGTPGSRLLYHTWVDDYLAFIKSWGFELAQIKIPVLLWHGKHDQFIPLSHGEWLAKHIPNVNARLSADDGHLTLALRRISEVHTWLLARME